MFKLRKIEGLMMMTLTIPDEIEQQLKTAAKNSQMTPTEFVLALLQNAMKQKESESLADHMSTLPDLPSFNDEPLILQKMLRDEWN
jgi:hypothetical protein